MTKQRKCAYNIDGVLEKRKKGDTMTFEEKQEHVIMQYKMSYDLDIAMTKVELTEDDKKAMLEDKSFMFRISYADATIREKIVETMVSNLDSENESLSQKAAIDLGNILYKSKFNKKEEAQKSVVPDTIILVGA